MNQSRQNSLIQFKRSDDLSEFQVNQSRQNYLIQFKRSDELSEFQVNQSRQNPMTQFKRSDAHSEFQVSQSSRQNSVIKSKHPGDSSVNQPSPILKKTDSQSDCQISPLSDQVKFPENQDSPVHSLQSNSPLNNFDLSQEDQTLTLKSLHELLSEERRSRVENEEKIRTLCATNEENIQKYLQQMASLRRDLEQNQVADFLTKALGRILFARCRSATMFLIG